MARAERMPRTPREPRSKGQLFGGKLNNGGMSLVEVIVAITILSIVIVPVMQSLTSAAFYNAKARRRQNVMLVAESLMETFKGYDLVAPDGNPGAECLVKMFDGSSLEILDKIGAKQAEDGRVTSVSVQNDASAANGGSYTFNIENMQTEDNKIYNVKITATPAGTSEVYEVVNVSPEKDLVYTSTDKNYSDGEIINAIKNDFNDKQLTNFLTGLTSVKALDSEGNPIDAAYLQSEAHRPKLLLSWRDITYKIEGGSGGAKLSVTMKCEYTVDKYTYYVRKEEPSSTEPSTEGGGDIDIDREDDGVLNEEQYEEKTEYVPGFGESDGIPVELTASPENVENSAITEKLERVFIYYYPLYNRNGYYASGCKDKIHILNDTGNAIECYLIKQRATDLSDISMSLNDANYSPDVDGSGTITLYHNLRENIGGNSGASDPPKPGWGAPFSETAGQFSYTGSELKKKKVLAYMLELTITDADTGVEVAKLEGSMSENLKNLGP